MYFVYVLSSRKRTLYVGVTNDLARRIQEHKGSIGSKFTSQYRVDRLVHFEEFTDIHLAITREKQIKGWRRSKKVALIESTNSGWRDLSDG